jgi:hypothetical protein
LRALKGAIHMDDSSHARHSAKKEDLELGRMSDGHHVDK